MTSDRSLRVTSTRASGRAAPNDAAVLLSKLGHRAKRMFTHRLLPLGLRANHIQALAFLRAHPDAVQRDLVEALHVTPSTVVELIDELEARGLARRRRNPHNRRVSVVALTENGDSMLDQALALSGAVEEQLLAPLGERDRQRFLHYLRIIDLSSVTESE
jgi:DNA-binding MarR family transcriptional regulator